MLLVVLALAFVSISLRRTDGGSGSFGVVRLTLPLPDGVEPTEGAQFSVSPDGTQIALAAIGPDGRQRLWVRRLEALDWRELPRSEGAAFPFWSPDGRHLGFFADRRLKRIDVATGLSQTLGEAPSGRGGTWSQQDTIVFAPSFAGPLWQVPASGGDLQQVTSLDEQETAHLWPHMLSDSRHLLFRVNAIQGSGASAAGTQLLDLQTGERVQLLSGPAVAAYAGGVLLFATDGGSLVARRFNPADMELMDDTQAIGGAERIAGTPTTGVSFSASGDVLVYRTDTDRLSRLTWFERGSPIGEIGEPADYRGMSLSPDGQRVAVSRRDPRDGTASIWIMDLEGQLSPRLTLSSADHTHPVWSPDGSRLAFASLSEQGEALYNVSARGGETPELLIESFGTSRPEDWSLDGTLLIYSATLPETLSDLWVLSLDGKGESEPVYPTPANQSQGRMSPDGRWIAYVSDESGADEVYVQAFPGPGGRWQVSTDGGTKPRWSRDGERLYFMAADGQLTAVETSGSSGDRLQVGPPRALFSIRGARDFLVAPAGDRFLVQMPEREPGRSQLHVVLNWARALRR